MFVPTAEYMLALKLKAIRILDSFKGQQEAADIRNLMAVVGADLDGAMAILRLYFPRSAEDGTKQRFLLKRLVSHDTKRDDDAPTYGR